MKTKKILIVGAGFAGVVIARTLAEHGYSVHIVEKRNHVGGNAYDFVNEYGIRVHKYGPHFFHTNDKKVVDWLSRFTDWVDYKHKVKALLADGNYLTLPPNNTASEILKGQTVLDVIYRPYTKKMWGISLEELDSDVLDRLKPREDSNELYFPNDEYQMMPSSGYTALFDNILDCANISIELNCQYNKNNSYKYDHIFNSMAIDEYFNYCYGRLPYRSIKFHTYTLPIPSIFPVATINFTHLEKFTRATEWKNIPGHGSNPAYTTITVEEPCDYAENLFERYYPINDIHGENATIYKKYTTKVPLNMTFIGRCGLYAYLDMHQAISTSLSIAKRFLKNEN